MDEIWICCEACGKKLLKRKLNGLFDFRFGRDTIDGKDESVVEMQIHGNLKMKCLRKSCKAWNLINYFPSGSP